MKFLSALFSATRKRDKLIARLTAPAATKPSPELLIQQATPLVDFQFQTPTDSIPAQTLLSYLDDIAQHHNTRLAAVFALGLVRHIEGRSDTDLRLKESVLANLYWDLFIKYKNNSIAHITRACAHFTQNPAEDKGYISKRIDDLLQECTNRTMVRHASAGTAALKICYENFNLVRPRTILNTVAFCESCYNYNNKSYSLALPPPSNVHSRHDMRLREIMVMLVQRLEQNNETSLLLETISHAMKMDPSRSTRFYQTMKDKQLNIARHTPR